MLLPLADFPQCLRDKNFEEKASFPASRPEQQKKTGSLDHPGCYCHFSGGLGPFNYFHIGLRILSSILQKDDGALPRHHLRYDALTWGHKFHCQSHLVRVYE